jgi:endonuclease III
MNAKKCYAIFERLQKQNPNPKIELDYNNNFELLIAVILSAHTTDKSVNKATAKLFPIANTPAKMLKLGEAGLKEHIKSVGLYNTKAKNVIKTCQLLIDRFASKIPSERKSLENLPGVGQKTAGVILNVTFKQPTIPVDTHIFRVANRTGLAFGKTPAEVEKKLLKIVPDKFKQKAHHWLLLHGRYICTAKKLKCSECVIRDLCEYKNKT